MRACLAILSSLSSLLYGVFDISAFQIPFDTPQILGRKIFLCVEVNYVEHEFHLDLLTLQDKARICTITADQGRPLDYCRGTVGTNH